ncbi:MAG: 4Fe-4S dicluster domain-containing protein [Vicinamibacterales bacterium]
MDLTRRTFFKVGAIGAATLATGGRAEASAAPGVAADAVGMLVDTTLCIGCGGCEAACAEANGLPEPPSLDEETLALRRTTDPRAFTVVNRFAVTGAAEPERFVKTQCMHCVEPACATVCPTRALEKTAAGPVIYHGDRCLGCRYCMLSCPFDVPKFEYDKPAPYIRKCTFCATRQAQGLVPACAEMCPSGALTFGTRAALLEEARQRIYQNPGKYVPHIYGEREAGGTSWLYISDVPLDQVGLKAGLDQEPYPRRAQTALAAVPMVLTLWPPILMGLYALNANRRRDEADPTEETRHD